MKTNLLLILVFILVLVFGLGMFTINRYEYSPDKLQRVDRWSDQFQLYDMRLACYAPPGGSCAN